MLQPHYSKLSHRELSHPQRRLLPTGSNFGGSNLNALPSARFTLAEIISKLALFVEKSSELLIQLLSLILVTVWFWGLLAVVNIALRWEKKIGTITPQKPVRVPFLGTLTI
jgi:hypothetical protein